MKNLKLSFWIFLGSFLLAGSFSLRVVLGGGGGIIYFPPETEYEACFDPQTESEIPCENQESEPNEETTPIIITGGPPTRPQVGQCVWSPPRGSWRCVPVYPQIADETFPDYRACRYDSNQTEKSCLEQWAEEKSIRVCGPFVPGTQTVEIPYQSHTKELSRSQANAQCGVSFVPEFFGGLSGVGY
jgi:uncharacterized protein YciI